MRLPKLNVELARKVKRHILAKPKRLDMDNYAYDGVTGANAPPCGTKACIAGWTVLLSNPKNKWSRLIGRTHFYEKARRLLGLTNQEAGNLFLYYHRATGVLGAKEVSRKIDALISARKNGEEFKEN